MFHKKFVDKVKTHILRSLNSFLWSRCLWDHVEKYGTARQDTDDNIIWRKKCAFCMLDTYG